MQNLTIFFALICISQVIFANPINDKMSETNNDKKPEKEMMETSANNIVFRPLFVYRQQQEARRRARQHPRYRRHASTSELINDDEPLPVLPLAPRTTTTEAVTLTGKTETTTAQPVTTTPKIDRKSKKAHHHDDSDLEHHESGVVFRPLFVYRQQQASRRRISAERRNQANRRYYESAPTVNYYPAYYKPYKPTYKPAKKDCHDPNKELYI